MTDALSYDAQDVSLSPIDHGDYILKRLEHYSITYECRADHQLLFHCEVKDLLNFVTFLYEDTHCVYEQLTDIFCMDFPGRPERFRLVYHLVSLKYHRRIALSSRCNDRFISLSGLFSSAAIYERAVWDLFGIQFDHHHDHRRLYDTSSFNRFPLRKDTPLIRSVHVP